MRSAGVQLNPLGTKTVTGNEGQYEFTELKAGNYTLQVTKTGYSDLSSYAITVSAGRTNKGDVQIEKLPPSLRITDNDKQNIDRLDFGGAEADVTRSFNIFNDGPESLEWQITKACVWITNISKGSGTLKAGATQAIIVTIDREKLTSGENTTTIHVTSDNGSKQLTVCAINDRRLATLNVLDVTNITATTATFNGKITDTGSSSRSLGYTERGFVYSKSSMPTLENTISRLTAPVTENMDYSANATDLTLDQKYYVRAYAINNAGAAYSSNETRFTATALAPRVHTNEVTNKNIGIGTVTFNGEVSFVGNPAYTERGFVYGLAHNPTVDSDTKKVVSGYGAGVFSSNMTGLSADKIYYVRAYAIHEKGTEYGQEVTCDYTPFAATVTTGAVTNIDGTTATFNGVIITVGDPTYTERGFVYSTNPNPTVSDSKQIVSGSGSGSFSNNISGLTNGTTYYVRAYATNSAGTAYGIQVNFKPESPYYVVLSAAGIMVQKSDISSSSITHNSAYNLCESSIVGGFTDWRMPTLNELTTIYSNRNIIGSFNSSLYNNYYWSSTAGYAYYYCVAFNDGSTKYDSYIVYGYCRCVRTLP